VHEGDRVLTSGDGGVLPRGLPVGRAVKGLDGRWRIVLDADAGAIDWVRILKFKDYSQLDDQVRAALARTQLPPVITENPDERIIGGPGPSPTEPARVPTTAPLKTTVPPAGPALTPAPRTAASSVAPSPKAAAPARPTQ